MADPWTNLFYALTHGALQPGDVLLLRGGTYRNSYAGFQSPCRMIIAGENTVLPLKIAGTQTAPIVIQNYPGETVVVDGTDADMDSATWVPCGTSSWLSINFNVSNADTAQIWVNPSDPSQPGTRLRYSSARSCIGLQPGEFAVGAWNGSSTPVYIRMHDDSDVNNADIHMTCQVGDCGSYPIHAVAGADWITVRRNASGGAFYVKYGYYNLRIDQNAQNLTFDGIQFIAAGGRDYGSCVRVHDGDFITIKNGTCRETMGEGIQFYGGGPGDATNGLGIQTSNNVVENMDVSKTGRAWVDGGGLGNNLGMSIVVKNCNDCIIRGNRMTDTYGPAVNVTTSTNTGMQTNNVIIENNTIWNFGYDAEGQNRDMSGIGLQPQVTNGMTGGTIRNNAIYNGMATHGNREFGILISSGGLTPITGLVIVNNSLNNLGAPCISVVENPAVATVANNVMNGCSTKGATCSGAGRCDLQAGSAALVHANNTYWATSSSDVVALINGTSYTRSAVTSYEATAVQADPQFTSATNLKLLAGSALVDSGTNTNCPAVDHDGVSRPIGARCDVGAYEFTNASPRPAAPTNLRIIAGLVDPPVQILLALAGAGAQSD